jgi:hypothetical protein
MRELIKKFLTKHYRHDRFFGRGEDYANCIINSHVEDLINSGIGCISRFESNTGSALFYQVVDNKIKFLNHPYRKAKQ